MRKIIIISMLILFFLAACDKKKSEKNKEDKNIVIGLSIGSLVLDRWEKDKEIFVKRVEERGGTVTIKYANDSVEKQIKDIEELIDESVDVIVIIPYDKDSLTKLVERAKEKGVKVISYDRLIKNSNVDMHVAFNSELIGKLIATAMLKSIERGNLVIINGAKNDENSFLYNEGIKNILNTYIVKGQINIVEEVWSEGWREKDAYDVVSKILESGKNIDGIIAGNDRLAEAAILALSEKKYAGKIPVVGNDADLAACQRIVEGTQTATIYKPFKELAEVAADSAVNLAVKKSPAMNRKIDDGEYKINAYIVENDIFIVDQKNIDKKIINSGIYRYEDVYLHKKHLIQ